MKQQIYMLSVALSHYNKWVLALHANEEKLNYYFLIFNKFSNYTGLKINSMTYYQTVTDHFNTLSNLILNLNNKFDVLIQPILFARQNVMQPSVITLRHLREQLLKVCLALLRF